MSFVADLHVHLAALKTLDDRLEALEVQYSQKTILHNQGNHKFRLDTHPDFASHVSGIGSDLAHAD